MRTYAVGSLLALLCAPLVLHAQDTTVTQLTTIEVRVARDVARSPLDLPYAVTITRPNEERPGLRRLSVDEYLAFVPGVATANRFNPTQDPRISIRGFGARSQFGARGVRVLRDGISLTLPDGQTPLDYLELESVGSIEVIRGSQSPLYGNGGAGGVIELRSDPAPERFTLSAGGMMARQPGDGADGSRNSQRWVLAGGGTTAGGTGLQGTVTRVDNDGYRQFSKQTTTSFFGRTTFKKGSNDFSILAMGYDMPMAQNPGALTAAELAANRDSAAAASITKRAGKEVSQIQIGASLLRPFRGGELSASLYGGGRDLENPLTFAIVAVKRTSYGAGLRASMPIERGNKTHRLSLGVDVQSQADFRTNNANCYGTAGPCPADGRGALTLSQWELVTSVGPYVHGEIALAPKFTLNLGLRSDYVHFEVRDELIGGANPDDSGERSLSAFSPMIGLNARLSPTASAYVSVSKAFETPTATELGNKPDGNAGINPELKPQYVTMYEIGTKALVMNRVYMDAALFNGLVRDELISFQTTAGLGRDFFRNAGRTERRGLELSARSWAGPVSLIGSYTYSDFRFKDFVSGGVQLGSAGGQKGRHIPGVPLQRGQLSATLRPAGSPGWLTTEWIGQGRVNVNDVNTASTPGYGIVNARVGGDLPFANQALSLNVGANNLFDRNWISSIAVNAAANRYYEPGPGRVLFVELRGKIGG